MGAQLAGVVAGEGEEGVKYYLQFTYNLQYSTVVYSSVRWRTVVYGSVQ